MSPENIIERLGGAAAVAAALRAKGFKLGDKAVEQWIRRSSIPGGWHAHLLAISRERGLALSAEDLLSATSLKRAS